MEAGALLAGGAITTGFGVVGWLIRRTVERQDAQERAHATLTGDVAVIRTALIGIDGKNGLRGTVTALVDDVRGLREEVKAVLATTGEQPAAPKRTRRR